MSARVHANLRILARGIGWAFLVVGAVACVHFLGVLTDRLASGGIAVASQQDVQPHLLAVVCSALVAFLGVLLLRKARRVDS